MSSISAVSNARSVLSSESRIEQLIGEMTLDEKIDCLSTRPEVPRLGIRASQHIEGLHGLALGGPGKWGGDDPVPTTTFPQAIGLAQTWDQELVRRVAEVEAVEARYAFHHLGRGGLVVRAPNADLGRDPRWGRTEECFGEDPFLVGMLATAFVRGLQGDDFRCFRAAALLKHFLANSTEDGRLDTSADIGEQTLREYYARPFERAVREGGARCFMAAYNAVNGVPCTVHELLDRTRQEWGVDGIICTDAFALEMLKTKHHYFEDLDVAATACIKAGITQFLDDYREAIEGALARELLSEAELDVAVAANFKIMDRLGLLDEESPVSFAEIDTTRGAPWNWDEHRQLAREATTRSIVLLKNEGEFLPLQPGAVGTIALIGPLADRVHLDWYSGTPPYWVSPLEGIKGRLQPGTVLSSVTNDTSEAIYVARRADVCIVCVGSHPTGDDEWEKVTRDSYGKESVDRKSLTLEEEKLVQAIHAVNPRTVLLLISSFPYAIEWSQENVPAIVHVCHGAQELGIAVADVLFGDVNPAGRLVMTWPRSLEQLPPMMDFELNSGRTYMYSEHEPLYPFGFGLSYTKFSYGKLETNSDIFDASRPLELAIDVTNEGSYDGDEVLQLYVSRPGSKNSRAKKELRGFRRVFIARGATERVCFELDAGELQYWNTDGMTGALCGCWELEAGEVTLLIGRSSADIVAEKTVTLAK